MSQRSISQNRLRFKHAFATLSLSAAVALASANAVAQQPEHAHSTDHSAGYGQQIAAQSKAAIESTEALINSHKQWAQAQGASNKAAALQNLIIMTEARRELMAELIKANPAEALRVAISEEKQAGMPAEVQAMLEQRFEIDGELEVIYEDYEDGSHKLRQFLKTPAGERFELHTAGNQKSALSGQQAQLTGLLLEGGDETTGTDGLIALGSSDDILIMGATGGDNGGTANVLPNTFGERKVAVMLVNFQDAPNDKPWSHSQIQNIVFGQVNDFIGENSYQQTWLNGDVLGWYTVPVDSNNCSSNYYMQADQAAAASGVNLANYDHIIYMLPPGSNCPSTNAGTVGGTPSRAWISRATDTFTVAHEFGHNLGLHHAHGLNCEGGVLDTSCRQYTYGDAFDVMGTKLGHLNAFNKELLGWLGYNQSPEITTVTTSGTYVISPMSVDGTSVKALRVPKGIDASTGQQIWYYLEYRQPIGFDQGIFGTGTYDFPENLSNGIVIHKALEGNGGSSNLLDMTPDSIIKSGSYDLRDGALEVGQTYTDSDAGVTITALSNDTNGITISVSFDGTGDDNSNSAPVAVADNASTNESTAISIPVLSNDYDADGDSLSITSTSGVNGSAQINGGNITFTPNTGFSGTETFSYSISDGNGGSDTATVSVTVTTAPASNQLPVALNDTANTAYGTAVTIAVLGNDYDPDGDSLTITGTSGVNGSAQVSGGHIIFTPNAAFSGTEVFNYTVSDGKGGTDTASVSVSVAAAPSTNQAPVAMSDSVSLSSVSTVTIPVLANDYDLDGDTLSVTVITGGNKGTISKNADGTLTYTPGRRFKNGDNFTYTVTDGQLSSSATVTIQLQQTGGSGGKGNGKKR